MPQLCATIPFLSLYTYAFQHLHYNKNIEFVYIHKARKWVEITYMWEKLTLSDHFSYVKVEHLGWLFIFNILYCYWKERNQLLSDLKALESPSVGICLFSLSREGNRALKLHWTCSFSIKLDTDTPAQGNRKCEQVTPYLIFRPCWAPRTCSDKAVSHSGMYWRHPQCLPGIKSACKFPYHTHSNG